MENFAPGPVSPTPQFTSPPPKHKSKKFLLVVFLIIVLALSGTTFAYIQKIGPFSAPSYPEESFLSNILKKSTEIETLSYSLSANLSMQPREKDAEPFEIKINETPELRQKYQNDYDRSRAVSSILSTLRYTLNKTSYPATLKKAIEGQNSYMGAPNIVDPATNKEYAYKVISGGKNFALKVDFETADAIKAIKKYDYNASTTIIKGNSVVFTKDSYGYFYLSPEPPEPFLLSIQEAIRSLPEELKASLGVSAASDLKAEMADWRFNVNAEGDFGDLTYKLNADASKINSDYYFRINNIPSLFLGDLAALKGKWIKISTTASSTPSDGYSTLGYLSKELPEFEKSYKENKQASIDFFRQLVQIADTEKMIVFKSPPKKENVDGRELIKYDISIRKESILPLYKKVLELVDSDTRFREFDYLADEGMIQYLQSVEFSEVFDYFDKNISFVLWADSAGYPAIVETKIRIVPPDGAVQLAEKQAELVFKAIISDINKPLNIQIPEDFTPVEEAMKKFIDPLGEAAARGASAKLKANLAGLRAAAELLYDKTSGGGYGQKAFALGPCKNTPSTLFGDKDAYKYIEDATEKNPSKATCVSTSSEGKVNSYAVSVPLPDSEGYSWCVDSLGSSKQILGNLKKSSCN